MRSTVTINLNKGNPRPISQDFYRIRPLATYLWWLATLYRKGARFDFSLRFRNTPPQRAWKAVRDGVRWAWQRRDPRYTVTAYSAHRYCADQIEGGRWFDTFTLEDSVKVWLKRDRIYFEQEYLGAYPNTGKRYSVLGGEDYTVTWTPRFGHTPSYIDTYVPYS